MRQIKQSTGRNVMVLMVSDQNHVLGVAGLTLTVTLSKNGGAMASISRTVTDRLNGWYNIELTAGDTDTIGDLVLRVTSTGVDPMDLVSEVVQYTNSDVIAAISASDVAVIAAVNSTEADIITEINATETAILAAVSATDAVIAGIETKVDELHQIQGLNIAAPSTTTPTTWDAGAISIAITGDGVTTTTMTRQP